MRSILDERRIAKRVNVSAPVRYQFKNPLEFGGCISADISETGIQIVIQEFIPLDSQVLLEVQLPTGNHAQAEAKVVWAVKFPHMDRYRIGLEFIEPHEARQLINHYIQWSDKTL